jgi:hypothetical protein
VIKLMHEQLGQDRVFGDIGYSWGDPNAYGHYEFDLTAKVRQPHRAISFGEARDFGRRTLQARLWPDLAAAAESGDAPATMTAADGTAPSPPPAVTAPPPTTLANAGADDETGDPGAPARTRPSRPSFGGTGEASGGNRGDVADRSNDSAAQFAIPEPLTQAQIDAMTIDEVRQRLSAVSEARKRIRGTDHPEADRLKSEFEMLMARLREGV